MEIILKSVIHVNKKIYIYIYIYIYMFIHVHVVHIHVCIHICMYSTYVLLRPHATPPPLWYTSVVVVVLT